jgi:tetratricopeptide (TPR) repeat protein
MCRKIRYITAILCLLQIPSIAQEKYDFPAIDSITYKYYLKGNWDSLINVGENALDQNIDYKFLRQRIGFAYFSGSDYQPAQMHFTKALEFDGFDSFSLEYLYLSFLYDGNDDGASVIAGRMNKETRKNLGVSLFKPVESIEAEYNFKYAGTDLRSNPQYFNIGINSRLGSRVSLFQMFSNFSQTITVRYPGTDKYFTDTQPEYYALFNFSFSPYLRLKTAYHYLKTTWSLNTNSANLGYIGLSADYQEFKLGADFSLMSIDGRLVTQTGLTAGIKSGGNKKLYATGEFYLQTNADSIRSIIYNQKAGLRLSDKFWMEGSITFGNLADFSEFSAKYIYNTIDPTSFRCGSTLFIFPGRHLSLWFNFSYEINYRYNQFSYLGGIKWKI